MKSGRSDIMDFDEFLESLMKTERVPTFPLSMYYTEGTKYLNLCQYRKALDFLNDAVKNDPTDTRSLLKRSKCHIALKDFKEAIEDASKVLNLCSDNVEAIDLKGQAQYLMGDFEGGYLTYSEGRRKKPVSNAIRLGKQMCEDALDNSLHPSRGLQIQDTDIASIVKTQKNRRKFDDKLRTRRSRRECFHSDRNFLEDLMADKNLTSIHGFCKEGIKYIKDCERFWSMVTPLHSRMKKSKLIKREIKVPQGVEKEIKICNAAKRRAENQLRKGRIDDCISEVGTLLNVTKCLPKVKEKEKMKFQCDAHHLWSLAYKKGKNHFLSFRQLLKELKIATEFNLLLPQTRAYHELGEFYLLLGHSSKALQCFNEVVAVMGSEKIEELASESKSAEDIKHLQEAQRWANTIMSSVMTSLRESIITPVVDTIKEYVKEISPEDLDKVNKEDTYTGYLKSTGEEPPIDGSTKPTSK